MQPRMQFNGWQDLMDRVHAGLIKEKDCAEVANGYLDWQWIHRAPLWPLFGEWWNVSLLINKVTSNWEVKRSLWITMNYLANLFFQTVKDYTRCKKRKTSKNLPRKHGWWREFFFHVFFTTSVSHIFTTVVVAFVFSHFWGTVWKVAYYLVPERFGAKGVSEIRFSKLISGSYQYIL